MKCPENFEVTDYVKYLCQKATLTDKKHSIHYFEK